MIHTRLVARLADTLTRHPIKELGHVPDLLIRGNNPSSKVLTSILEYYWAGPKIQTTSQFDNEGIEFGCIVCTQGFALVETDTALFNVVKV